jgi:hypothetical protein
VPTSGQKRCLPESEGSLATLHDVLDLLARQHELKVGSTDERRSTGSSF